MDEKDVEGPISPLVAVSIPVATQQAADIAEAIERAQAWLESKQNEQGFWGDKDGTWMLATTQVLNAFKLAGMDNAGIRQALFYLRGQHADNNDFLARQILTLHGYGQSVDELATRLVGQGRWEVISYYPVLNWGIQKRFSPDALDTALGERAILCASHPPYFYSKFVVSPALDSLEPYRFGWIPKADVSIYVSALVYNVTAWSSHSQWIIDSQNTEDPEDPQYGSFGNSSVLIGPVLIDTAGALAWLSVSDPTVKNNAITYLVRQQGFNGSWNDDPYLTGLCLEALSRHSD